MRESIGIITANGGVLEDLALISAGIDDDGETHALVLAATVPGVPLRENYHPLTGEGRNVSHFSWTAALFIDLIFTPALLRLAYPAHRAPAAQPSNGRPLG